MASKRDDFKETTKDIMAKRVGYRCSNPSCRKPTCGASDDPNNYSNIGVAAHICAAARGGKRYDPDMSKEERRDIHNGIWLCQSCSKLIDSDDLRYTVDLLHRWKRLSEEIAILDLETASPAQFVEQDKELIRFYIQCFDRPAFGDEIRMEFSMEDFDRAIEDTIIALNTGVLRTRDGSIIKQSEGKAFVQNPDWREKLYNIVDILTAIRRRLSIAARDGAFYQHRKGTEIIYVFHDPQLEIWLNSSREEILRIMSTICKDIGVPELHFTRCRYSW